MNLRAEIKGIQEAQEQNLRLIAFFDPGNVVDRGIQVMQAAAHRVAVILTHVETGALRASHRQSPPRGGMAVIALDSTARNPRSGVKTSEYGVYEHARGGTHAFYARTVNEFGEAILKTGENYYSREMLR